MQYEGTRHKNIHPTSSFSSQQIETKRNPTNFINYFVLFDIASYSSLNNPSKLELASMSQKLSPIQGNRN